MDLLNLAVSLKNTGINLIYNGFNRHYNEFIDPKPIITKENNKILCNLGFYDLHISIFNPDVIISLFFKGSFIKEYHAAVGTDIKSLIKTINEINIKLHSHMIRKIENPYMLLKKH